MNTINKQAELVANWGFNNHDVDSMIRNSPEGYIEIWSYKSPEIIFFFKNGKFSHKYKIDWSLFN